MSLAVLAVSFASACGSSSKRATYTSSEGGAGDGGAADSGPSGQPPGGGSGGLVPAQAGTDSGGSLAGGAPSFGGAPEGGAPGVAGQAAGAACGDGALSFSGGQFVDIPGTETLQLKSGLTLEAWIKTSASVAVESLFLAKHSCGTDNGYFLELYTNSSDGAHTPNAPAFYVGANTHHVYGAASVVDGKWHHIAGTWDGATSTLYVDGQFVAAKAVSYDTTNSVELLLGAATTGACRNYTGLLDEVSVWSVVRSAQQIAADAAAPIAPGEAGLEAYFDFNGAKCGKTLSDRSPHGRNGLLGGSPELTPQDPVWVTDGPF